MICHKLQQIFKKSAMLYIVNFFGQKFCKYISMYALHKHSSNSSTENSLNFLPDLNCFIRPVKKKAYRAQNLPKL